MSFSNSLNMSKSRLLPLLTTNAKNDFTRRFTTDSSKWTRREVISVDPYDDAEDVETHTGQKFEIGDRRRVRFMKFTRYVNPNIAMELVNQVPPIATKERIVWCDGGHEHLGHPKVYINLDKPGNHTCGYCGLRFVKENNHDH